MRAMVRYVWTILFAYGMFGLLFVLYRTVSRHPIPSQHSNPADPYRAISAHQMAISSIGSSRFFFFFPSIRCS